MRDRFLIGVNYWPSSSGPFMWQDWSESEVKLDFDRMSKHGFNAVRVFLFLPDFMKEPQKVDEGSLRKLDALLRIANETGLKVLPSVFVGHMSGENWDFPWSKGQDFYRDPDMLASEELLVSTIARRYGNRREVIGWILSNELPLYAGDPDPDTARSWTKRMVDAFRREGDAHPISTGDGMFSEGFRPEYLWDLVDWIGPHVYSFGLVIDPIKWSYLHEARVLHAGLGKPVLMEEFGCSKTMVSEDNEAAYYRNVIYTSLMAGSKGFLGWCYSDFSCKGRRPYLHHPHELEFGVFRLDGTPRPSALELRRLSKLNEKLDLSRFAPTEPQTVILLPSYQYINYPFIKWRVDRNECLLVMLDAFTMCRLAGQTVKLLREVNHAGQVTDEVVREKAGDPSGAKLMIAPCPRMILSLYWDVIERFVKAGGTFYLSYSGDNWNIGLERMFGVRLQSKYGEPSIADTDLVELRFARGFSKPFGMAKFKFPVCGEIHRKERLQVTPNGCEVAAVDHTGEPALVTMKLGKGRTVLLTYPFEYFLSKTPISYSTRRYESLYLGLSKLAGVQETFTSGNRLVELGELRAQDTDEAILVAFNHSWQAQKAALSSKLNVVSFTDVETGEVLKGRSPSLRFAPKEARVFRLEF